MDMSLISLVLGWYKKTQIKKHDKKMKKRKNSIEPSQTPFAQRI